MTKNNYEVYVGNVGLVYNGTDNSTAKKLYSKYKKAKLGRAAKESVILFKNGQVVAEYNPEPQKGTTKFFLIVVEGKDNYVESVADFGNEVEVTLPKGKR
jgi:hypothetical protein